MNRQLSLKKVLLNDYGAFLAWITPIVSIAMYLVLEVTGEKQKGGFDVLLVFGGLSLAAVVLLLWRISIFTAVFNDGLDTPATISQVNFFRDRGRISYVYTFQGQKYRSGNAVMKTKLTRNYQVGDEVMVLVDRSKPKRAFVRDLYMS